MNERIPQTKAQMDIVDRGLICLSVAWLYISVSLSIIHYQNLSWWDFVGTAIGSITATGYWLKLKAHQTLQRFMLFVLGLCLVVMLTMFLPGRV